MRTDAFSLLEDAVHLLRRAGFASLVCHWSGSVPFALAFLVCWNSLASGPVSDAQCAAASLALALLLVWMNCRRAVFAGRLLRQLSGAPATPWTRTRIWRFAALQAFLAATKPLALLVSLLVLFPFARTVAFYRSAAALGDREDLDPLPATRQARLIAAIDFGQTWKLLPLLLLLQVAVWANLALAVAMMPQLVRILTGYESTFSRSGIFFVVNPLFFLFVLALSWLAFDPFVQAVYCVRCFQAESRETGEDIRAGLRLVRAAQEQGPGAVGQGPGKLARSAVLLLLAAVSVARAADAVTPADLEQSVRQTMQAPDYAWRIPPPAAKAAGKMPWIVVVTDRVITALKSGLKAIGKLIMKVLDWLFDRLGVHPSAQGGAMPSSGLDRSLYLLMGVIVLALAWVVWRRRLFQRRAKPAEAEAVPVVRLEEEGLTADLLPEETWLQLAEQCLREENFLLALRAFFLANLAFLGRLDFLAIHAGKTNHEYEVELRRRARPFPEARDLFAGNVAGFERAWYGRHAVSREQVEEFRQRSAAMKSILTPPVQEVAA